MDEDEKKVQRYVRVPVTEKNYNFMAVLNDRTRRLLDNRIKAHVVLLIEKLRRGAKI